MAKLKRIFLEKIEDALGSKDGLEYRGRAIIRSPFSLWTKNYAVFIRTLNVADKAEDERLKIPLKMDITSDMCSREGFLRSIDDYLESQGLYFAEASVGEPNQFSLLAHYSVRGELYKQPPTST